MSDLKTVCNEVSVASFLETIVDDARRQDCFQLLRIMKQATGAEPKMWGSSIVGFGSYHYRYASGREGDWFLTGFSSRKRDLTLYTLSGLDRYQTLLDKLGKHKTSRACLYLKKLSDVDLGVLHELVSASVEHMKQKYC